METQPTQPGMMQLFMRLGLATDNPLTTLNSASSTVNGADSPAFGSILAEYKPDSKESALSLLAKSGHGEAEELTNDLQSPLALINASEAPVLGNLPLSGEALPLINSELPPANAFKPEGLRIPDGLRTPEEIKNREGLAGNSSLPADDTLAEPSPDGGEPASAEANPAFHAQSLVSSLLPMQAAKSVSSQVGTASIAGSMNSNTSLRTMAGSASNPGPTMSDLARGLNTGIESELNDDFSAGTHLNDRFLGAERLAADGSEKPVKISLGSELSSSNPVLGSNNPIPQPLVDPALLAVADGEDPVTESLQDLKNLADAEKLESENKLTTNERRQDDQTLKLTKGQQAWGDALSERIAMNAAKDIKQVTIHLDPPELGSLELKLQIKDDQQTQVQVQVQSPQVKEALESSAQRLKDMLANQGLELSEFDVQTGAEQGKGQDGRSAEGLAQSEQQDSDASLVEGEELSLDIQRPKNNNLLDTFV